MFRATNSPIFRNTFDCIYSFVTMLRYCCRPVTFSPVGSNIGSLYQKLQISQKVLLRMGELSPETCIADLKISIGEICCNLLIAYIVLISKARRSALHVFVREHCNQANFFII